MTEAARTDVDPTEIEPAAAVLAEIERGIADNAPASGLEERLTKVEAICRADPALRASFLRCCGIVLNRLGLSGDALGNLHEAKGLFEDLAAEDLGARSEVAATCREIARVHAWRGEGREAALALLQAFAASGDDAKGIALCALESGRLNLEIGRLADARELFKRALAAGDALPKAERVRARILLVQTLVAMGQVDEAETESARVDPAVASGRAQLILAIESARIAMHRGDTATAGRLLAEQKAKDKPLVDSFEDIELCEAEGELAARSGQQAAALEQIRRACARFAEDDLAAREIGARIKEADILETLGRHEEAAKTLLAALRRAVSRDLTGYADSTRAELAKRSVSVLAWTPGSAPGEAKAPLAGERFVRRRPLGEGGFGSVSKAYDLESGEEVALKQLRLSGTYDGSVRTGRLESARHEAAATSRLQHPGIGRVYGLIVDESGEGLLVRELVEGPTLREAIAARLAGPAALSILTEFAQAVAAIHAAGIVHRDLKPENIVLRGGRHPVVIDFGASSLDVTDKGGGFSALYAAPEQIEGRPVDKRADLFAVSMIFAEVLLGCRPDRAESTLRGWLQRRRRMRRFETDLLGAEIPQAAATFLVRALYLRPARRPATIDTLITALQARQS